MAISKRLLSATEEYAKKHDDHNGLDHLGAGSLSRVWRGPRRKRILFGIIGVWVLYIFFKNVPTDLTPGSRRIDTGFGPSGSEAQESLSPTPPSQPQFNFDGPVKFYNLASTLRKSAVKDPDHNTNVLFAFSSLKSASNLLPLACEMSRQPWNKVHFAFLGRDEVDFTAIKDVNGITDADCAVQWHDGRPDYASVSSDNRMRNSIRASLSYLYTYVRMPVVIIDDARENQFFTDAVHQRTSDLGLSLIALPRDSTDSLRWLAKLESGALKFWNKVQIDIVVHSSAESSASLIRLLRSMQNADYFGRPLPRLTVELTSHVDPPTLEYLSRFRWPPTSTDADSKLVIRHRTKATLLKRDEASLHTVETFYPANGAISHLLILTPDAELSPSYYHYLMYAILEYKYSSVNAMTGDTLLGISLDLPAKNLNGSGAFSPSHAAISGPCFLWQAPNSNAALYFGDKWVEFHSFLSKRLTVESEQGGKAEEARLVSAQYPDWLEYMLELMRARGYSMLYPAFAAGADSSIATIHQELYQRPEESVEAESTSSEPGAGPQSLDLSTVLTAEVGEKVSLRKEAIFAGRGSVLSLLSQSSPASTDPNETVGLPSLEGLQLLSFAGEALTSAESAQLSSSFADEFSIAHGGCKSLADRRKSKGAIEYLFCLPDLIPVDSPSAAR